MLWHYEFWSSYVIGLAGLACVFDGRASYDPYGEGKADEDDRVLPGQPQAAVT